MGRRIERYNPQTLCLLAGLLILVTGCPQPKQPAPPTAQQSTQTDTQADPAAADQILAEMLSTYRKAKSYRDQATMVLSYRQHERLVTDEAPIAVSLQRPNQLRVRAFQVTLACDGREIRASIADPATNHVDGQFLIRGAPPKIKLADLLEDPLVDDQLGSGLVLPDAGRLPLQLAFLLADKPVELVSGKDVQLKLLDADQVDGHECDTVQVTTSRGAYRFWVDRRDHLLRRLEYPRSALVPRLADATEIKDVRLVANFSNAELNGQPVAEEFTLEAPADARLVRFFVPPPQPLPTDKLGKNFSQLEFTTPDGSKVNRETLGERPAVFLWFSLDDACEPALQQLAQVRRQFAADSRAAFYAVATEPTTVSHQQLRDALRRWRVELPLARDLEAHGRDQLGIEEIPSLAVFDGQGNLQLFEVGVNPQLAEQLPGVVQRVLAGDDLAAEILKLDQDERRQYQRRLELASSDSLTTVDVPNVPIAAASAPGKLTLEPRWTNTDLKQPGNMVVIDADSDEPRLVVLDQGRRLVTLKADDGSVVSEVEIQLPPGVAVDRMRTIVDNSDERLFALFSPQGSHMFLSDAAGAVRWSYPPDEARHEGIRDVILADLDANGTAECYVGFLGSAGLHGVSLEGKRVWNHRAVGSILSMALTPPNPVGWRKLIAVGSQGQLVRFNQFGNADTPQTVSGWAVVMLTGGAQTIERAAPFCGLGMDRDAKFCAVALSEQLTELWNYPLPEGVWRSAVERVTTTTILGSGHEGWLVAGVDGAVHMIRDDGEFSDHFHLGWLPSGLGSVTRRDGTSLLIAAGESGITAWNVTLPDGT